MRKKKTVVVGAGWFGRAHIRNFYNLSNLVAICDNDEMKVNQIKEDYNDVNFYLDIDEMIKNEEIDAVSIVTQPKQIPPIAKKFADKGIDILINYLTFKFDETLSQKVPKALAKIGGKKAVDTLIQGLSHDVDKVRDNCAQALGEIGTYEALNALITSLNQGVNSPKWWIIKVLGEIGGQRAIEALISNYKIVDNLQFKILNRKCQKPTSVDIFLRSIHPAIIW